MRVGLAGTLIKLQSSIERERDEVAYYHGVTVFTLTGASGNNLRILASKGTFDRRKEIHFCAEIIMISANMIVCSPIKKVSEEAERYWQR